MNLLKSGETVLRRLAELYYQLWTAKAKEIDSLGRLSTQLGTASVTLLVEHLLDDQLTRAGHLLDVYQSKLSAAQQYMDAQQQKWSGLLSEVRKRALEQWNTHHKPRGEEFMEALGASVSPQNRASYVPIAGSMGHPRAKDGSPADRGVPLAVLLGSSIRPPGLAGVGQASHGGRESSGGCVPEASPGSSPGGSTAGDLASSPPRIAPLPSSTSPYQQFRAATAQLQQRCLTQSQPLEQEYGHLKRLYESLRQQLAQVKQQRADLVGNPDYLRQMLSSGAPSQGGASSYGSITHTPFPPILTRPDLHFLVQSHHSLDNLERQADAIYTTLHREIIPQLTQNSAAAVSWKRAEGFIRQLPTLAGQWSQWVSDEATVHTRDPRGAIPDAQQYFWQAQLGLFELRSDAEVLAETHVLGIDHVQATIRKRLGQVLVHLQSLWNQLEPRIADLFTLLQQIQVSLADQPSALSQQMSHQLLLEQARFVQVVQEMELRQQQDMVRALWKASGEGVVAGLRGRVLGVLVGGGRGVASPGVTGTENPHAGALQKLLVGFEELKLV